ncbi:acetyltransferase [Aerococcus urinaeequi]|uniref:acetyltransferase n=1 Tax=Aerococcus urinaeequi TaxID=51665 RepID=UPI0022E11227|nr:acetyltransferase [Aerococcus urinaeequi]
MSDLIIIGAGGHGRVISDIADMLNRYNNIYFMDDYSNLENINGKKNLGSLKLLKIFKDSAEIFVAIGDNQIRENILTNLLIQNYKIATLIHPKSIISDNVSIGVGTVIMGGVAINNSTKIGLGSIINTNSSVDHDCVIGDYVHISPGTNIAGTTVINNNVWLGVGVSVINNIFINKDIVVGAGGVIVNDLLESGLYIGIPAKKYVE